VIIDKVTVYLRSGRGGQGSSALVRNSSGNTMGCGGDGGKGGSVILRVNLHLYDLNKFRGNKKFIAKDGERGNKGNKKGKDSKDLIVNVPSGTIIREGDKIVADLVKKDDEFLACRGGKAGKGSHKRNFTFPAQDGEQRSFDLDYRIPGEVAILGFANSGKTTLFNALTDQNRKVAEYPFTTTSCLWAKSEYEFKEFTVLDTPPFKKTKDLKGLSENSFLRHIFRSKIILFLSNNFGDLDSDFKEIKMEIDLYDPHLLKAKKIFYLLNKIDTIDKRRFTQEIIVLSPKENKDITQLKQIIIEALGIK